MTAPSRPSSLPAELTSFVGRDQEVAAVRRHLGDVRLLTLVGAGGCGKSRLALRVAGAEVDHFPGGMFWVELAPLTEGPAVPDAVLAAAGLSERAAGDPVSLLYALIAGRRSLLILDNCEHLADDCAEFCHALLRDSPDTRVLATSREALGVAGEQVWRVPSLSPHEAVKLFTDRASSARADVTLDAPAVSHVERICRRLDGMPLAIELAAARVSAFSTEQIADGLDDRFSLLTGGPRMALPRHRTLLASVAWSHDLLTREEQVLLRRLSVFAGGFSIDAAQGVGAGEVVESRSVPALLGRLVDRSLVSFDDSHGEGRHRLLETIRQYAAERLYESGEETTFGRRHLEWFTRMAVTAEARVDAADQGWLDRLEVEHDNLRAAHHWGCVHNDEHVLRMAGALTLFWYQRGHYREGRRLIGRALEALPNAPAGLRARGLWGLGHLAFYHGDYLQAIAHAEQALSAAEEAGDDSTRARALGLLGWIEMFVAPQSVRARLEPAISLACAAGDGWCLADTLQGLGWTHLVQEDHAAAAAFYEQAVAVPTMLGNPYFLAWNGVAFGIAAARRGELQRSRAVLEEGIAASKAVGEPDTLIFGLAWLCWVRAAGGDLDGARDALGDGDLARMRGRGLGGDIDWWLAAPITAVDRAEGRLDAAVAALRAATDRAREEGVTWPLTLGLVELAACAAGLGDRELARVSAEEAVETGTQLGNGWAVASARRVLGQVALEEGDAGQAQTLLHDALATHASGGFLPDVVLDLEALAAAAAALEAWHESARLLAASECARDRMGLRRWAAEEHANIAQRRAVADKLGDAAFDAAWAEGGALSLDEAVAYARRARGERRRPATGWASLTPAEQRVVALVVQGLTNQQIGERLFMSLGTVKTHLGHVFTKLELGSRAELVAEAVRRRGDLRQE